MGFKAKGNISLPAWFYKGLIVVATIIWGFSFVVMKDTVNVLQPAYLIGIRFSLTGLVLMAIFWKPFRRNFNKECLYGGVVLGVLNYLAFWLQTIGLDFTTPGKNAFLTGTYCVIVPFAWWLLSGRRPSVFNVVAAVMAVAGIGFVSLQGTLAELGMGFGDAMTLVCAVLFAVHIVYVSKFSKNLNVLALTVFQFLVGGVCGLLCGAVLETPPPLSALNMDLFWSMFYLVVFASCMALVFENVALAHVPPAQGSLLLSLESVFGVVFSVALYGEQMTARLVFGFALIFAAILVSEALPMLRSKKEGPVEPDEQALLEAEAEGIFGTAGKASFEDLDSES